MRQSGHRAGGSGLRRKSAAAGLLAVVLLLVTAAVGGTAAFLMKQSAQKVNQFVPSQVSCEVTEEYKDNIKSSVNVRNTSDISAYIRVKLVTYRVNDQGQHIGGTAALPDWTPGAGWVQKDGYWYYTSPVQAGEFPEEPLIGTPGIELCEYTDQDGGKQVIEVMAEAIQSEPASAVLQSWGVDPSSLENGGAE